MPAFIQNLTFNQENVVIHTKKVIIKTNIPLRHTSELKIVNVVLEHLRFASTLKARMHFLSI